MPRVSNIEAAVLGLLYYQSHYGYELEKIIEERGMRKWTEIGFSSIYYVLNRLEKKGLIESEMKGVEGRPSRKLCAITKEGRGAMRDKVRTLLSRNVKLISPFDLGLAYIYVLRPAETAKCLDLYLESLDERLQTLKNGMRESKKKGLRKRALALYERPLAHTKTEWKWVEQYKKRIESGEVSTKR